MAERLQRINFFDNAASGLFAVAFARYAMTRFALAFDPADLNSCGRAGSDAHQKAEEEHTVKSYRRIARMQR